MHPHPPMPPSPFPPYQRWYTDVEPAYERPAECECHFPPIPNNCVCVTEEDAQNWNGAYETISAVSAGLDIQAIASAAKLLTSADYWNQTYNVVSAGSATWNRLPEVSGKLAEWSQSALYLINTFLSSGVKVDLTLTGDGVTYPLGVAYSEQYDQLLDNFRLLAPGLSAAIDAVYEAMKNCESDVVTYIKELSGGHIQNYNLIRELMGGSTSSDNVKWINDNRMVASAKNTYAGNTAVNCMYFSTYEG